MRVAVLAGWYSMRVLLVTYKPKGLTRHTLVQKYAARNQPRYANTQATDHPHLVILHIRGLKVTTNWTRLLLSLSMKVIFMNKVVMDSNHQG